MRRRRPPPIDLVSADLDRDLPPLRDPADLADGAEGLAPSLSDLPAEPDPPDWVLDPSRLDERAVSSGLAVDPFLGDDGAPAV